ncbi:hypothetical protein ACFV9C_42125 [Kribbella sp. NPDC059898]|uniref:hypothetical protein n=1 Tax=Kribbella sp. NPDC059898 TaxID=3346995 RepID=UPI00364FC419
MTSLLEVLSRRGATSAGPRRRKWLIRMLAGLFVIAGAVVLQTGPAAAICEGDPPAPTGPDTTIAGWLTTDPDWSKIPDQTPDPFKDPKIPFTDVYGYGAHWGTYDLGCGSDTLNDPGGVMFTKLGNLFLESAKIPAVAASSVKSFVTGNPFDWMNSTLTQMNLDIDTKVWRVWFPVSVMALGCWFVWRARRADFAETSRLVGITMLLATVSVFFLQYPTRANDMFDKVIGVGVNAAASPFSSGRIDEQINRQVLYPAWLKGELGSSDSETATKYGPDLYASTHYSWSDVKSIRAAGDNSEKKQKEINKAKADRFKKLAEEIKKNDPEAYKNLTGKSGENRFGAAIFAGCFSWPAGLYFLFAMLMVAMALLMTRGFVMGAPLVAIVAIHPKGWTAMQQLFGLFTSALFNAAKFTFAGALYAILTASLLSAPTNALMKLFFLIVVTIAAFVLTKPFRAMKTIIPGMDPNHSYLGGMVKRALNYATTRKATRDGVNDAGKDEAKREQEEQEERVTHEEQTIDPIPDPEPSQQPQPAGDGVETTPKPAWSEGQKNTRYEQVFVDDEPAPAPPAPALNPAPAKLDSAPATAAGSATAAASGAADAQVEGSNTHGPHELPPAPSTTGASADADASSASSTGDADQPGGGTPGGGFVAQPPAGSDSDDAIYRDSPGVVVHDRDDVETEVPIAEKQLDDNGNEEWLIYRTADDEPGRSGS